MIGERRTVRVRGGEVTPSGSWVYVWIDEHSGDVAYVGATGFEPELRAHVHLADPDPSRGRVRAEVPRALERDFVVEAFRVPDGLERAAVKAGVRAALGMAPAGVDSPEREFAHVIVKELRPSGGL